MNSKSSTFNVYHATSLYQPNGDNKTASLFFVPAPKTNFGCGRRWLQIRWVRQLDATTMLGKQPHSPLSQIVLDDHWRYPPMPELLKVQLRYPGFAPLPRRLCALARCPTSLLLSRRIITRCIARNTASPKERQWFTWCQYINHFLSSLHFEAQLSQHLNPESRRLSPWTGHRLCSTSPEPFFATIRLIPSLAKIFQHVPHSNHVFYAYSAGKARHSILSSVRMELAELPDVQRMSVESIDRLVERIAHCYSSFFLATSQALESYLPFWTAVLFSIASITLSLLTFTISFTLFRRQWKRPFLRPHKFFKNSKGRLLHVMDDEDTPAAPGDTTAFLQLNLQEFNALKALANETLNQPPPLTNAYTACNNPQVPSRVYPDITAPLYTESTS